MVSNMQYPSAWREHFSRKFNRSAGKTHCSSDVEVNRPVRLKLLKIYELLMLVYGNNHHDMI